jgi:hypothetical protein
MTQRKPPVRTKRLVWRITEAAPLGEFVDPDAAAVRLRSQPLGEQGERSRDGWVVSSFELLHGTDICEDPDTVPDELFDELFAPPKPASKPADSR